MPITRKSKHQLRKRLQNYIIDLPGYEKSQIRYCGYRNDTPFTAHEKIYQDDLNIYHGFYFKGYQTCGTIFCPVCSGLIKTYRAHELNMLCKSFDGNIYLFTFTISHHRSDSLQLVYETLKKAYRKFSTNDATKKVLGPVDGTVRSFEVTHSINGWHPHYHILFFVPGSVSFSDDEISKLSQIWSRMASRAGGSADQEKGLLIQSGDHAASYVCKLGSELNGQECKDSCDFLQLLVDRKKSLVQEYLTVLKGVHWLEWSKGLRERARLSLPDVTDSQIVQQGLFVQKRQLDISQLTLNFLQDCFFDHDRDGKWRDYLTELLQMRSARKFVDGPKIQAAFDDYCKMQLKKNSRFSPDRDQFIRDMEKLGFNFYDFV